MRPNDYPRIKFADENHIHQQMEHIQSEMKEVWQAFSDWGYAAFVQGDKAKAEQLKRAMGIEMHDLVQSSVTLVDIADKLFPELDVWGLLAEMIEKNAARGYYEAVKQYGAQIPRQENNG